MTYIPDMAAISYLKLKGPIRAVGWLESPHTFNCGSVDPEFSQRLIALVERPFFGTMMLGMHYCSLCEAEKKIGPDCCTSQAELLIPAPDCVYEAPIWIGHYVLAHSYQPPDEFVQAVMTCPAPGSDEFRRKILAHIPELDDGMLQFVELEAQETLQADLEYGSLSILIEKREEEERNRAFQQRLNREQIIREHGGLSKAKCAWQHCENRALADMAICFEHAYPIPSSASQQGAQPGTVGLDRIETNDVNPVPNSGHRQRWTAAPSLLLLARRLLIWASEMIRRCLV